MGQLQISGTCGERKHTVGEVPRTRTCFDLNKWNQSTEWQCDENCEEYGQGEKEFDE